MLMALPLWSCINSHQTLSLLHVLSPVSLQMSTISEAVKELIPQHQGHPKPDQGQVKNNQGQTKVTVKKETPIKKHVLRDLVSDLPKLSQLFNDLGLGETKISQKFSDFARFVSSPESWKHKLPLKKLLAQSKQLEKKLNEAMRNVESKVRTPYTHFLLDP